MFGPNRDAGCVSRHRNPSTRRRVCKEGYYGAAHSNRRAHDYRRKVNQAVRMFVTCRWYETDLSLSIAPLRVHGWDNGDKLNYQPVVIA